MSAFGLTTIPPGGGGGGMNGGHRNNNQPQKHNSSKNRSQGSRNASNNNNKTKFNQKPQSSNNSRKSSNRSQQQQQQTQPSPPLASAISDPEYVVQTKMLPTKTSILPLPSAIHDQFIGPLIKNAENLGYQKLPHRPQELPNYLIQEQKFLDKHDFKPDEWDILNQQKMLELEQNIQDTNELMDVLEEMRKTERTEMENRGLVDKANVSKSLADAIVFRGSCLYMCPVFEKVKRNINGDLSKYEKDPMTNKATASIKTFSRSEAGQAPQLPSDVRPPHVLVQTLDYMISNLIDKLPECESFIWNRTRSIRQDFTYQNYFGPEAIYCIEKICRIHILTLHVMANSEVEYSQQQELEQLNKSLETLNEIYDDLRKLGRKTTNEAEFRAYYIISYYKKPELDQMIQNLPMDLFQDPFLQMAIMFRGYLLQNNTTERDNLCGGFNFFTQFFKACYDLKTPFLMSCLLEVHFNEVRFYALKSMSTLYHSGGKPYYATQLGEMLGFDNVDQLLEFVDYYDMSLRMDNDQMCVYLSPFKYNFVKDKEKLKQCFSVQVDAKMTGKSYKEIIDATDIQEFKPVPVMRPVIQQKPVPKPVQIQQQKPVQMPIQMPIQQVQPVQKPIQPVQKPVQVQQPVQPVKPVQKPKITELAIYRPAVEQIYQEILYKTVNEELNSVIPKLVSQIKNHRARENMINSLGEELYGAFMNEVIHLAVAEIEADKLRQQNLKKMMIRVLKPVASKLLSRVEIRRSKMKEYDEFKNSIGKRVISDTSMIRESLKKQKLRTTVTTTKVNYNDLWDPLELQEIFISHLPQKVDLKMLCIVKNWNELCSRWLMHKLNLKPTKSTFVNTIEDGDRKIKISGLPDQFHSGEFAQTGFIIIEIAKVRDGIDKKLQKDCKVIYKILEYIEQHSLYQVSIMILNYQDITVEEIEQKLKIAQLRSSKYIRQVQVLQMSQDISQVLSDGLTNMAKQFQILKLKQEETPAVNEDKKLAKLKRYQYIKSTLAHPRQISLRSSSFANETLTRFNNDLFQNTTTIAGQSTPITNRTSASRDSNTSKAVELRKLAASILQNK